MQVLIYLSNYKAKEEHKRELHYRFIAILIRYYRRRRGVQGLQCAQCSIQVQRLLDMGKKARVRGVSLRVYFVYYNFLFFRMFLGALMQVSGQRQRVIERSLHRHGPIQVAEQKQKIKKGCKLQWNIGISGNKNKIYSEFHFAMKRDCLESLLHSAHVLLLQIDSMLSTFLYLQDLKEQSEGKHRELKDLCYAIK